MHFIASSIVAVSFLVPVKFFPHRKIHSLLPSLSYVHFFQKFMKTGECTPVASVASAPTIHGGSFSKVNPHVQ